MVKNNQDIKTLENDIAVEIVLCVLILLIYSLLYLYLVEEEEDQNEEPDSGYLPLTFIPSAFIQFCCETHLSTFLELFLITVVYIKPISFENDQSLTMNGLPPSWLQIYNQ